MAMGINANILRALKKTYPSLDCSKADTEFTECHAEYKRNIKQIGDYMSNWYPGLLI